MLGNCIPNQAQCFRDDDISYWFVRQFDMYVTCHMAPSAREAANAQSSLTYTVRQRLLCQAVHSWQLLCMLQLW